jgi:hypothetical protein
MSILTPTCRESIEEWSILVPCLIAGIRLARETHVNHRVIPTSNAINESVDLAYEIFNRVFRKVPERLVEKNKGL